MSGPLLEPGAVAGGRIAAIGEPVALQGFALAGVTVLPAVTPEQARARWAALPRDVALVLLTPAADAALAELAHPVVGPLVATLPGDSP